MNIAKDIAIELGKKVLVDINFWTDDMESPVARFDPGQVMFLGRNTWNVSFGYGSEEFGRQHDGSSPFIVSISIDDDTKEVILISYKGGHTMVYFNDSDQTYHIKKAD